MSSKYLDIEFLTKILRIDRRILLEIDSSKMHDALEHELQKSDFHDDKIIMHNSFDSILEIDFIISLEIVCTKYV